jgi:hypothetical protein
MAAQAPAARRGYPQAPSCRHGSTTQEATSPYSNTLTGLGEDDVHCQRGEPIYYGKVVLVPVGHINGWEAGAERRTLP